MYRYLPVSILDNLMMASAWSIEASVTPEYIDSDGFVTTATVVSNGLKYSLQSPYKHTPYIPLTSRGAIFMCVIIWAEYKAISTFPG